MRKFVKEKVRMQRFVSDKVRNGKVRNAKGSYGIKFVLAEVRNGKGS